MKTSIIIPAYNVAKFIPETIKSIKQQTAKHSDFETIIIDDGSTDNTAEIISKQISNLSNIVFVKREKNLGVCATRNQAIELAKGKYMLLLDGDDVLEPQAIESTLEFMERYPDVHYSYSKHKRIDTDGNLICSRPSYPFSKEKLLHFNFAGHVKCFTKEIHGKIGGFDTGLKGAEDWDHVLRASEFLRETQIKQNPVYLYKYRIHNNNTIKNVGKMSGYTIKTLEAALIRRGIKAEVFWSHKIKGYNYYNWRKK